MHVYDSSYIIQMRQFVDVAQFSRMIAIPLDPSHSPSGYYFSLGMSMNIAKFKAELQILRQWCTKEPQPQLNQAKGGLQYAQWYGRLKPRIVRRSAMCTREN